MKNENIEELEGRSWKMEAGGKSQFSVSACCSMVILSVVEGCKSQFATSNSKLTAHSQQLVSHSTSPLLKGVSTKETGDEISFTTHGSRLVARSYSFTLCPVNTGHLPQGRNGEEAGITAQSSKHEARGYLKENSTVQHSNTPQKRACINNASTQVVFNTGEGAEGLAFRACELLLN